MFEQVQALQQRVLCPKSQPVSQVSTFFFVFPLKVSVSWCFQIVVLENSLESPLDYKEIKPVNHKGNQHWIFIGSADAEAAAPILWPPNDANSRFIGKDPDAGKDWE